MHFFYLILPLSAGGLKPHTAFSSPIPRNLRPIAENNSCIVESDDDASYQLNEDFGGMSVRDDNYSISSGMVSTPSEKKTISRHVGWVRGGSLMLPLVVDVWFDSHARARRSIQVQAFSGSKEKLQKETRFWVSSDQQFLVCNFPMSKNLLIPKYAFSGLGDIKDYENHPKIIARQLSVQNSKIKHFQLRVSLGAKCRKQFVTKAEDPKFYGSHILPFANGEKHFIIELFEDVPTPPNAQFEGMDSEEMNTKSVAPGYVTVAATDAMSVNGMSYYSGCHSPRGVPSSVSINASSVYDGVHYGDKKKASRSPFDAIAKNDYEGGKELAKTSNKRKAKYQVSGDDNHTIA